LKGIFISFEGIEGSGKSTQASLLSKYLSEKGYETVLTAEPGGTPISQKIREILLSIDNKNMTYMTELLLYNAARVQHIHELIMPALNRGAFVITDRFTDSTYAYQGYGRGISLNLLDKIDLIATNNLRPDLTFLLDLDVETGLMRNKGINKIDRLELEDIEFHKKVRAGYLALAEKEPDRIKIVDASMEYNIVYKKVISIIANFISHLDL
jgi:dTMP kinase